MFFLSENSAYQHISLQIVISDNETKIKHGATNSHIKEHPPVLWHNAFDRGCGVHREPRRTHVFGWA